MDILDLRTLSSPGRWVWPLTSNGALVLNYCRSPPPSEQLTTSELVNVSLKISLKINTKQRHTVVVFRSIEDHTIVIRVRSLHHWCPPDFAIFRAELSPSLIKRVCKRVEHIALGHSAIQHQPCRRWGRRFKLPAACLWVNPTSICRMWYSRPFIQPHERDFFNLR